MNLKCRLILEDYRKQREDFINLGDTVHTMLSEIVNDLGMAVLAIEHRVKEEKSLAGKLERKGDGYNTLEDITDILGCRVICFLSDEIDKIGQKIEEIFAAGEIDRLFINFPDPWPRKKNAKRRLTYRTFLDKYCRVVKENGEIHYKTDNAPLFEFSVEEFAACGLEVKNLTRNLHENGIVGIMTGYEEKFHALGTPINRCEVVCKPFQLPPVEKKSADEGDE